METLSKRVNLVERNYNPGGVQLVNTITTAKRSPTDLVELAMEIQKSDTFVHANASNKLQIIAQQVRFLHEQAKNVLQEAKLNTELHHVPCNFVKVPGNTYHLYKRSTAQCYFSMLSPEEWPNHPHEYLGSYRLEQDHSWTTIQNIQQRDVEFTLIDKILTANEQTGLLRALQDASMEM